MLCRTLTMLSSCNYIALLLTVMVMLQSKIHVLPFDLVRQWQSLCSVLRSLRKQL